jgi:SAM-dependent methyltransferase
VDNELTVTAADIARMAEVGRTAVSNWRKRHADFPKPVGGTVASPVFSLAEVKNWLAGKGKLTDLPLEERLWQQLKAAGGELRLADLIGTTGQILLHPEGATKEQCPELSEQDMRVARAVASLAKRHDERRIYRFFAQRYVETYSRRIAPTPQPLIKVVTQILGDSPRSVLDPACGTGALLAAVGKDPRRFGQEADASLARIAAAWFAMEGHSADIRAGDSFLEDAFIGQEFDAVVCHPPFGDRNWGAEVLVQDSRWLYGLPSRMESELAWVQHCLAHVRPGGLVVVAMPEMAANRRSGRRVRGNLLRGGVLRAVITGIPDSPDLWVLRRPLPNETSPDRVLMVDAAGDPAAVATAWHSFDTRREGEVPGAVRVIDLLDEDVDLTPARYAARGSGHKKYAELRRDLLARPPWQVPMLLSTSGALRLPMVSIAELLRADAVKLLQAPLKMRTKDGDVPVLTAKDVRIGRPASGRGRADEPGSVTINAGDVVVTMTAGEMSVRVCDEDGMLLGPQVSLLRVDAHTLDPHFLAGFLRAAAPSTGSASSYPRSDLRRWSVPRMSIEDQRRYGRAFRQLTELDNALDQLRALGERLIRAGFQGLADGTLHPGVRQM